MSFAITTNNVPRDIIDGCQLTPAERAEFDYIDWAKVEAGEDSASFFRYQGTLYDLSEFQAAGRMFEGIGRRWDGYQSDSFFSGLLVRYQDNFERVIVGRYYA